MYQIPAHYLSIGKVAKHFGVSQTTVKEWERRGIITPWLTPGGHRRYVLAEVQAALDAANKPATNPPLFVTTEYVADDQGVVKIGEWTMHTKPGQAIKWPEPMCIAQQNTDALRECAESLTPEQIKRLKMSRGHRPSKYKTVKGHQPEENK